MCLQLCETLGAYNCDLTLTFLNINNCYEHSKLCRFHGHDKCPRPVVMDVLLEIKPLLLPPPYIY